MLIGTLKKLNLHVLVLLLTMVTVAISGGVTTVILMLVFGRIALAGILLSTIVPIVLAPPQLYFFLLNRKKLKAIEIELKQVNEMLQKEIDIVISKEKELKALNARIEHTVKVRTRELEKTVKEKEVLLNEVHHRVKNNLQVILSIIRLQKQNVVNKKDKETFEDLQYRIFTMALVYEQLYKMSEFEKINLRLFLAKLTANILASSRGTHKIELSTDIDDVLLNINKAIPLSLLVTEILSNSIKHAFPNDRRGEFKLTLKKKRDSKALLTLADNGVGFKKIKNGSLGLKIIDSLVQQLNATMKRETGHGVKYIIDFEI
jgi:two-component sensor histidine kinase